MKELQLRKKELENQTIETIYLGGGTPSLLNNEELTTLIDKVHDTYNVIENPEITIEANPDDLTKSRIKEFSISPINRLSIGVQSFFKDDLKSMNRAHNSTEAIECLEEASKYFDNITIDLIYGIPNMSLKKWDKNLQLAFQYGVNHISSYALTVESKTALDTFIKKGIYPPIDEDLALQHFNHLIEETDKQGFVQYEISNFGKPHYFSKHNTSYWHGKSYLGIGPSAHSYNKKERSWNISNNTMYIQSIQQNELPSTVEILSEKDRFNEYVMTGLRTIWGISLHKIQDEFDMIFGHHLLKSVQPYLDKNLLKIQNKKISATQKGKFLIDGIASDLFMI